MILRRTPPSLRAACGVQVESWWNSGGGTGAGTCRHHGHRPAGATTTDRWRRPERTWPGVHGQSAARPVTLNITRHRPDASEGPPGRGSCHRRLGI